MTEYKKNNKNSMPFLGLGVGLGVAFGLLFKNLLLGLALGIAIGTTIDSKKGKKWTGAKIAPVHFYSTFSILDMFSTDGVI